MKKDQSGKVSSQRYAKNKYLVDIVAVILSIAALGVSLRGCQLAQEAQSKADRVYREERSLVLTAEFTNDGIPTIKVKSTDPALTFLEGTIHLPNSIYPDPIPVLPTGDVIHLGSVQFKLQQYISKKVPPEKGFAKVSSGGKLPIFVQSYYTTRGESYTDQSLYFLGLDFLVTEEDALPKVTFESLVFAQRYPTEKPLPIGELDKLIADESGFYIAPRSPK